MWYLKKNILKRIIKKIGKAPIESGGILGVKNNKICKFYYDRKEISSISEYIPNVNRLNNTIRKWAKSDITFAGFVHSHANDYNKPSLGDKIYLENIIKNNVFIKKLLFPIVTVIEKEVQIVFYEYIAETNDFYKTEVIVVK